MYTREIQENRHSPVEKRIPLQGTWTKAFKEVDLADVHSPYSFPVPNAIKDSRIKEWESFFIQNDRFFIHARLCNIKYYRTAFVLMYDKETKEHIEFNKTLPGGGWRLPRSLANSSVDSRSLGFFFRIHSWLDAQRITLELNIEPSRRRQAFTAHAVFDLSRSDSTPMAVSLLFFERRNMYAYKTLTAVSGNVVTGGRHIYFDPEKTTGLFCDFKGYYPYQMRCSWCTGMGFDSLNRRFGFTLGENQAREPFKNNENALWIDGKLTPLPPVKITRGSGDKEADWIIQDMEGMVDLVFTPQITRRSARNILLSRMDYESPLGTFSGTLVGADGAQLPIQNVWGTCEKLYLRV
ncbi:MAG: DUF2804 domain-containing protein [Treponema sp.]|nr:DUF2804 domain-containing protein [Treponema sp.]